MCGWRSNANPHNIPTIPTHGKIGLFHQCRSWSLCWHTFSHVIHLAAISINPTPATHHKTTRRSVAFHATMVCHIMWHASRPPEASGNTSRLHACHSCYHPGCLHLPGHTQPTCSVWKSSLVFWPPRALTITITGLPLSQKSKRLDRTTKPWLRLVKTEVSVCTGFNQFYTDLSGNIWNYESVTLLTFFLPFKYAQEHKFTLRIGVSIK